MNTTLPSVAAIVALAILPSASAAQKNSSKTHVRHIFVSVTDANGPVQGLSAADFKIAEAGQPREVVKAGPAKDPTVHAFVLKTPKGSGMPDTVSENLTHNTGGRYDVMNTTTALPEKMKALGEKLALDHRNLSMWYEVDIQTESDTAAIDVAVAREGVRLQISNTRR